MSDYRVDIKVRNNNILRRINEAGYKTLGEICRLNPEIKSSNSRLGDVVNMKISPLNVEGKFIPCVENLSEILGCSPEDLFTETQLNTIIATNKRTMEVAEAEMQFLLRSQPSQKMLEEILDEDKKIVAIDEMLDTLTPREKRIIEFRNGLNGEESLTYEQYAKVFDCTRERIRQIEAKALRKLRHPSRSNIIRPFLEENEE